MDVNYADGNPLANCTDCGAEVIAATASEFISAQCVRNEWFCGACGSEFQTFACLNSRQSVENADASATRA